MDLKLTWELTKLSHDFGELISHYGVSLFAFVSLFATSEKNYLFFQNSYFLKLLAIIFLFRWSYFLLPIVLLLFPSICKLYLEFLMLFIPRAMPGAQSPVQLEKESLIYFVLKITCVIMLQK